MLYLNLSYSFAQKCKANNTAGNSTQLCWQPKSTS